MTRRICEVGSSRKPEAPTTVDGTKAFNCALGAVRGGPDKAVSISRLMMRPFGPEPADRFQIDAIVCSHASRDRRNKHSSRAAICGWLSVHRWCRRRRGLGRSFFELKFRGFLYLCRRCGLIVLGSAGAVFAPLDDASFQ